MKTTIVELRNYNIGYTLGKDGITEADLQLVNGIIDKIEQTRTRKPQPLDVVEYTDSFGCYYPNAIIDGDTYRNGSTALCECGSSYISVSDDGTLCKSISGGAFPLIDKDKLRYIGKKEKIFWTFSTLGAGAQHALYFKAEVSCFELNLREESLKRYTTKDIFMVRLDWSTTDADGIDTELYEDYDEAYDRYKEIITEQLKNFWQGEVTFDTDGNPGEEYEFSEEDNNSNESDVYWHLSLKDDYYVHTFVDLIRTPLHTKQEETV